MDRWVVIALIALAGCTSSRSSTPAGQAADSGDVDASTIDTGASLPYGGSCSADKPFARGTCPEGLECAIRSGTTGFCVGYCPCAAGGACVESPQLGDLCLAPCAEGARCPSGFTCDPTWQACVPTGTVVAPRLATCSAPPLMRKSWSKAVQVSTTAGPALYDMEPQGELDTAGNLVIAYNAATRLGTGISRQAIAIVGVDGSVVSRDVLFPGLQPNNIDPWMAADRGGRIHYVWFGFDDRGPPETHPYIGYATTSDGKTWSASRVVHDLADCGASDKGCLDKPMIAIGPDRSDPGRDAIHVIYATDKGSRAVHSLDGGKTFSSSVPVPTGYYGSALVSPTGVVYSTGTHVGGDRMGDVRNQVVLVRSSDGGASYSDPMRVSREGEPVPSYFSNPWAIVDETRKLLYVVYTAGGRDGVWDIVLATSKDDGKTWSHTKVNDDTRCANHATPQAVLDPTDGRVHVSWIENRSGAGGVAYTSCESGGAACGANEAVSDTPFASYALVRWSPRWMGEYGTMLLDSKRRVLHRVWAQTVAEPTGATSRIFHASRKL